MRVRLQIYFIASLVLLAFYAPTHAIVSAFYRLRDTVAPQ